MTQSGHLPKFPPRLLPAFRFDGLRCSLATNRQASAAQLAGLMYRYPEIIGGSMIARQIVDQLLALPAALMRSADPLDNPVDDATKRKRSACSDCDARSSLCTTRHENLPTCSGSTFSLFVPFGATARLLCLSLLVPPDSRRGAVRRIAPRRCRMTNSP